MHQLFNLKNRTALITGASGAIGSKIAEVFHHMGASVILSGTKRNVLEDLAGKIGSRAYVLEANLSDKTQVEKLIDSAHKFENKLDILVCNAGITRDTLAIRMKTEDFEEVINVNLTTNFVLCRDAIKIMMKQRYGKIINIASIVATMGNIGQANYAASKAGLIGMTKTLALETASRNITVNAIAPGFVISSMTDAIPENKKQELLARIPVGRYGEPADIANAALYLASEESSYVTGEVIHINGGMHFD